MTSVGSKLVLVWDKYMMSHTSSTTPLYINSRFCLSTTTDCITYGSIVLLGKQRVLILIKSGCPPMIHHNALRCGCWVLALGTEFSLPFVLYQLIVSEHPRVEISQTHSFDATNPWTLSPQYKYKKSKYKNNSPKGFYYIVEGFRVCRAGIKRVCIAEYAYLKKNTSKKSI